MDAVKSKREKKGSTLSHQEAREKGSHPNRIMHGVTKASYRAESKEEGKKDWKFGGTVVVGA